MKFIHTFWTKPALNNRWNEDSVSQVIKNIWYYSLSVAYIKRLDLPIELHTDDFGKHCLDHLSYDNIHLTLNTIPEYIKPYQWAYGKFLALKNCDLDTIHIDGDVFIKHDKCINRIQDFIDKKYDAIFQCKEHNRTSPGVLPVYKNTSTELFNLTYPIWGKKNGKFAYNTGIILFNNQEYKDEFLKEYFRCHHDCATIPEFISKYNDFKQNGGNYIPDLVLEQQFMYDLAKYKNYKIGELIDYLNLKDTANEIGYQHVLGKEKYDIKNIKRCVETIKNINYHVYQLTNEKCKQIRNELKY